MMNSSYISLTENKHSIDEETISSTYSIKNYPTLLTSLLEKCQKVILESNALKDNDTPAAVILQSQFDPDGAFIDYLLIPYLKQLVTTHYIVLYILRESDTISQTVARIKRELGNRPIMKLFVKAHGNEHCICLGERNRYTALDIQSSDFAALEPQATIILNCCAAGQMLAKKVAILSQRTVFAPVGDSTVLYGELHFTPAGKIITHKFEYQHGVVTETAIEGHEIERTKQYVFTLINKAAHEGDALAQNYLGYLYREGLWGLNQSSSTSIQWFEKSAKQGNPYAQFAIGIFYWLNQKNPSCLQKAKHFLKLSAEQGVLDRAYLALTCIYVGELARKALQSLKSCSQKVFNVATYCFKRCFCFTYTEMV